MDYLDMCVGASLAAKPEVMCYQERDTRCLPIRLTINAEDKKYNLFGLSETNSLESSTCIIESKVGQLAYLATDLREADKATITAFSANDCVQLCQRVLGLKVNEIAKLIGISRASLDLHRKGANIKDMSAYEDLFAFVTELDLKYGSDFSKAMRNVLVQRKTLLNHLLDNRENLDSTFAIFAEVAPKLERMQVNKTSIDQSKANLRLSGIGRIA